MEYIYKLLGRECKRVFVERIIEGNYGDKVFDIYKDKNKNGLYRHKKVLVTKGPYVFNGNSKLISHIPVKDKYIVPLEQINEA